jgi:hypothetical protein
VELNHLEDMGPQLILIEEEEIKEKSKQVLLQWHTSTEMKKHAWMQCKHADSREPDLICCCERSHHSKIRRVCLGSGITTCECSADI